MVRKVSPSVLDIQIYSVYEKLSIIYRWKHVSKDTVIHRWMEEDKPFVTEATKERKGNVQNFHAPESPEFTKSSNPWPHFPGIFY